MTADAHSASLLACVGHSYASLSPFLYLRTEVIIYLVERSPNGTSKRIPATTLSTFLEQNNVKTQLSQLGVLMSVTRTELSPAQLKQLLQNAPAGGRLLYALKCSVFASWKQPLRSMCPVNRGGPNHLGAGQGGQP